MADRETASRIGSSVKNPAHKAITGAGKGNARQLREYWVRGEGAAKIRWQEPGAFDRCMAHLGKYFPADTGGLCHNYFKAATGIEPGTLSHGGK